MLAALLLGASAVTAQIVADSRLRSDWNDLVADAAEHGLILSGTAHASWMCLRIEKANVAGTLALPGADTETVVLRRAAWNLFRLTVTFPTPVTLDFPSGEQLDLWSHGVRFEAGNKGWDFHATDLAAALHGDGPDDVVSIGALDGRLSAADGGTGLRFVAGRLALPARGAWPNGRLIERLDVSLLLGPDMRQVGMKRGDIDWSGQKSHVTFAGTVDDDGRLGGSGEATLGPGWASTLKHARATGALDAGRAEAAIGFLGLLEPDERHAVSFPFTVAAGRVRVGRTTLFGLPSIPLAR